MIPDQCHCPSIVTVLALPTIPSTMEKKDLYKIQEKKVEELHRENQQWKSALQFMDDEIMFIRRLLDSYVFRPDTHELFERRENFRERIKAADTAREDLSDLVYRHENILGGMLECTDSACDLGYYQKHDRLKTQMDTCMGNFQNLKAEIFNYAGNILKKRKPIDLKNENEM